MHRNGFKWSVNEVLSLQREFELLEWDIDTIAHKHQRSPNAIMYKLDQEQFADYNVLFSAYHNLHTHTSRDDAIRLEVSEKKVNADANEPTVSDRIKVLETSVDHIVRILETFNRSVETSL